LEVQEADGIDRTLIKQAVVENPLHWGGFLEAWQVFGKFADPREPICAACVASLPVSVIRHGHDWLCRALQTALTVSGLGRCDLFSVLFDELQAGPALGELGSERFALLGLHRQEAIQRSAYFVFRWK
jgi:hypothetical protein